MSLSNEPEKLANTALDIFSQSLNVECCWIQTVGDKKDKVLTLAAERGLSDAMRSEILDMDMNDAFSSQIVGMGHKIIIPDINNDGAYGLGSFGSAGYRWLVAVPLMTYRVYGILGAASHNRRILHKDTADLVMVIAGLIAGALNKAHLARGFPARKKPAEPPGREPQPAASPPDIAAAIIPDTKVILPPPGTAKEVMPEKISPVPPPKKSPPRPADAAFNSHTRKMQSFRKSHR
ncbi:MAG: GAF domain-containing protein [Dehalococcoidales bacterium]